MASYISDLNSHALPMLNLNDYYIDHFDDTLTVFQTFQPENLKAELNVRAPDTIGYDISLSSLDVGGSAIVTGHDFIGPHRTGWLLRQGWTPISAGLHTSRNIRKGQDFMSVGGKDWLHYFERRQWPFNGDTTVTGNDKLQLESFTGSKQGFGYHKATTDIATHLKNILDHVLAKANSWPIDTSTISAIGKNINYEIVLGEQRFISDMISELSDIVPGFDFEVTWDMVFSIASPYFFGDPTVSDPTDPSSSMWAYTMDGSDENHDPLDLEFTDTGPVGTHVSGYGSDASAQMAVTKGYAAGQAQFHRLDSSVDYSNIPNRNNLDDLTSRNLAYGLNPQHEIPISVIPSQITNFWTKFKPGRAIWVDQDLVMHQIQSGQRIVSMTISDNESIGEPIVELGLNQVYGTSDTIGAIEG